uniref:Uncharacterized protein n=1 Tax=Rhizophora mucronata TaxID=61149 RepID=A0A2P2QF18_RHIMU
MPRFPSHGHFLPKAHINKFCLKIHVYRTYKVMPIFC